MRAWLLFFICGGSVAAAGDGPAWPNAFSVDFNYTQPPATTGFNTTLQSVGRISFDWSRRSERIDHESCFCPHIGYGFPCTAFFLNHSFIAYAPKTRSGQERFCCLMQPFGPTPPTVFQTWAYNGTVDLQDAATGGRREPVQKWDSPGDIPFRYYTTTDSTRTGMRLHDGRDQSEYTFGAWDATAPDKAVFDLPQGVNLTECYAPCVYTSKSDDSSRL
jgi:hypothetical protein